MMNPLTGACGCGKCVPPIKPHVVIYFLEKGLTEKQASEFFDEYAKKDWNNGRGVKISNWKVHAWEWVWSKNKGVV